MPKLCVNIDHIATLRNARAGVEPEPLTAMSIAELAGAYGIIIHLREDRRHIMDRDVVLIRDTINTRMNLEMAATQEMQAIALDLKPETVCLVPEKRQELTTEGGLAVAGREDKLREYMQPLWAQGIETSLFVDADPVQLKAAAATGTPIVEIHTGHYADARGQDNIHEELRKILDGIALAQELGLKVNLGHGLNYTNILSFKEVPNIMEYSIGHSIIARAVFVGLDKAVRDMVSILRTFVD